MKATRNLLLAASMAALATPVAAHQAKGSGEAASLEEKEVGPRAEEPNATADNRGRPAGVHATKTSSRRKTVARAASHKANRPTVAKNGSRAAAIQPASSQHTPTLKTGQLTSTQSSRVATKQTSAHDSGVSSRTTSKTRHATPPEDPQSGKSSIRLPKHNARMF